MAVTSTPVFPQLPKNGKTQLTHANTPSVLVTLYTAGANGSKIHGMSAVSSDSIGHDILFGITNSGTFYPIGTVTVAAGAGNGGDNPSQNLMSLLLIPGLPVDSDGNPEILLISGDILQIITGTTVTSPDQVTVVAIGADF